MPLVNLDALMESWKWRLSAFRWKRCCDVTLFVFHCVYSIAIKNCKMKKRKNYNMWGLILTQKDWYYLNSLLLHSICLGFHSPGSCGGDGATQWFGFAAQYPSAGWRWSPWYWRLRGAILIGHWFDGAMAALCVARNKNQSTQNWSCDIFVGVSLIAIMYVKYNCIYIYIYYSL